MKNQNKDNLTYRQWMKEVDKLLEAKTGLWIDILPDWTSRDSYESGASVKQGVQDCLDQMAWYGYEFEESLIDEA